VRFVRIVVGTLIGVLVATTQMFAHHAFSAEFAANKPVRLEGTVSKIEWTNPHVWIHIDVKRPDAKVETWGIEGGAPNALMRRGFRKASLPIGTPIIVEGFRAKDGSLRANGRELTMANGEKLFMGSSGTGAPSDPK